MVVLCYNKKNKNAMLIITEENKRLKGTKHKLPDEIVKAYGNIVANYPQYVGNSGYIKAKNIYKNGCYVTMEWLKNMKHFFTKHKDESDIDFMLAGGFLVKNFVDEKLRSLTNQTLPQGSTQSSTKPRKNSSNLSGNRGDKSSKSLSIANNLMSGLIPKFESKIFIINDEQIKILESLNNE